MRRTHQSSALTALAVTIGVTLAVLVPFATRAGAQTTEHRPSCSLHPTRHDTAGWIFENHNHERRFLTATTATGTVLFNDWLYPITQVGDDPSFATPQLRQTPLLVGLIHVMWAGDSYGVAEYALPDVHFCAEAEPPTTTSTVPLAPPTTAPPPTTTTPPPTVPPTTIPAAPPVTEPTLSCLTARCEFTVATVATVPDVGVEAASATRAAPLPNTGSHDGPLILLGGLLLLGGGIFVSATRRNMAAGR